MQWRSNNETSQKKERSYLYDESSSINNFSACWRTKNKTITSRDELFNIRSSSLCQYLAKVERDNKLLSLKVL